VWADRIALSLVHLSISSVSPGIEQAMTRQEHIERRRYIHRRHRESIKSLPGAGGVCACMLSKWDRMWRPEPVCEYRRTGRRVWQPCAG
jgi:hypothetical protein